MNDLVSVIIPVYNVEKYLQKCIDSVLNQSYKNLDIILINDGSTDNSGDICNEYARRHKQIRVITQENRGLSGARNAGLDLPDLGKYIMFLDSDDALAPNIIEETLKCLVENDADYVRTGFYSVDENGRVLNKYLTKEALVLEGTQALTMHYEDKLHNVALNYAPFTLYKRELFDSIRFKENLYYEDIHIMPYVLMQCKKIIVLPIIGYYYLIRSNSISRDPRLESKRYKDSFYIWNEHIALYQSKGLTVAAREVKCLMLRKLMEHFTKKRIPKTDKKKAKAFFVEYYKQVIKDDIDKKFKRRLRVFRYLGSGNYKRIYGMKGKIKSLLRG